ncbi:MAG TPA: PEP-CTERM sorting domain-containing protein [Bryobacteraceae bacterium]|nr:PEP-CTERM sorting domain-containing protein [Bryobacteraceae bacterium]HOL72258.1 PEP-CTERM sorting domain-containing protein [Bryobacteraceae bacterium]HPQ14863.1 PEP-CTERM sorting domain-containing protein [Bryobacteraceae bacterium]
MLRVCLILGMAIPVWAMPITGEFSFSANSNFTNITGSDFAWQFHQGEASTVYTQCPDSKCSVDGSAAPAMFALLMPDNWFLAAVNSTEAYANLPGKDPRTWGAIGGSIQWQVDRTDWSDIPLGSQTVIVEPMKVTGLLTASDDRGQQFMNHILRGSGRFETEVVRFEGGVAFLGDFGRFEGEVEPLEETPEPAAFALAGIGMLLLGVCASRRRRNLQ